jgi:hypothetical protein
MLRVASSTRCPLGLLLTSASLAGGLTPPATASDPPLRQGRKVAPATPPVAPMDLARYPDHVPEWLWQDQPRSAFIAPALRKELESDLKTLAALEPLDDQAAYEAKHSDVRRKLNGALALRDLAAGAMIVADSGPRLTLAVQVDPTFDPPAADTVRKAVALFIRVAVDPEVVREAVESSIDRPEPMPAQFKMKGGLPEKDEYGHQVFTDDYKNLLADRYRPRDTESFTAQVRAALSGRNGDPALLVISRHTGGKWWGAGRIGYSVSPNYQLAREFPPRGYLYVSLCSDRLTKESPGGTDPAFWAGKLAHEVLHNLGYNHPTYDDLAHRDANNQGNRKAFIVAYEQAVIARAKGLTQ